MRWKITWTQIARTQYAELLLYVEATYGLDAAERLFDKIEITIERLSLFPKLFPFSKKVSGHKAVVTKQTSIIYIVGDTEVFILRFADNRME